MRPGTAVWLVVVLLSIASVAEAEPGVRVWGHRGARTLAPENSLKAYRKAWEVGADGVELDARLTRDGVAVIHHSGRVTLPSGKRVRISRLTLAELKQIDLGDGERIPTLREALHDAPPDRTVNIEIKAFSLRTDRLARQVVADVRAENANDRVVLSSFNPRVLRQVQRAATDLRTAILLKYGWRLVTPFASTTDIHPHMRLVTPERVRQWHQRFDKVRTWTANTRNDVVRVRDAGVDGIMTDNPRDVRATLDESPARSTSSPSPAARFPGDGESGPAPGRGHALRRRGQALRQRRQALRLRRARRGNVRPRLPR